VLSVAFPSIRFRFNQNGAAARACIIDRLLRHFVTGNHVVSIDDVSGNAERGGFLSQVSNGRLHAGWCRVRVLIVFGNHDERQFLHGGEVHAFVKRAGAGAAIADVSQAGDVFLLQTRAHQNPRHHRNHVAEVRNRPDETLVHVAEVHVQIFSARRSPGFGHVLRKDLARPNAFHKTSAEVANDRRNEILRPKCVSRSNRSRFLAQ
jgi:hypothetical protein